MTAIAWQIELNLWNRMKRNLNSIRINSLPQCGHSELSIVCRRGNKFGPEYNIQPFFSSLIRSEQGHSECVARNLVPHSDRFITEFAAIVFHFKTVSDVPQLFHGLAHRRYRQRVCVCECVINLQRRQNWCHFQLIDSMFSVCDWNINFLLET